MTTTEASRKEEILALVDQGLGPQEIGRRVGVRSRTEIEKTLARYGDAFISALAVHRFHAWPDRDDTDKEGLL